VIPVSRPEVTEKDIEAVTQALRDTQISGESAPVRELESSLSAYLGIDNVMAVANGTTALDLVFEALDLGVGDTVIVPNFTIISSVSNLLRRGVQLLTIDSLEGTWCMNSNDVDDALNETIAAVVAVHMYGLPVNLDTFIKKSRALGATLVEDSAESLGLEYNGRRCGSLGDVSTFSFFANKIISGGEGGAIATNNLLLANEIKSLRNLYFSPKERFMHEKLGWNARMHGLSAALANSQLSRIDDLRSRKKAAAKRYLDGLRDHPWLDFQSEKTDYAENDYWVFGILLNSDCPYGASEYRAILRNLEVDTRRFFCPISLQPLASDFSIKHFSDNNISENLWHRGLYIPSGNGVTNSEIDQTIEAIWKSVNV